MEQIFTLFTTLFEKRYSLNSVLNLGEDSVRYDFFVALKNALQLESWQIQLEHPIDSRTFVSNKHEKSKRDEKPQIDLWVNEDICKIAVEFAFFKRNKVDGSPGNDTEYAFKILNDFMRLGLQVYYTKCEAYFVCVADEIMLGKQLNRTNLPTFPGQHYVFNSEALKLSMNKYKSAKKIDTRFFNRFKEINFTITADLVFNQQIISAVNPMMTKALVWEVKIS